MKNRKYIVSAPIIVVVLGLAGYVFGEKYGFYESLLASLNLLKVELGPLPSNPLLEVARWIGIIFLFGLVYTGFVAIIENNRIWHRSRNKNAVGIHGESQYMEQLSICLGDRGIHSDNPFSFKAPKQVIMFNSNDDTLAFYQAHLKELEKAEEVHLCLDMGTISGIDRDNVILTNISEVKAISYWREHFCTKKENMVIIGSGQLAEAVLYWGLLTNIFDPYCNIKYIIFGDFDKFKAIHPGIGEMVNQYGCDSIEFIDEEWYKNTSVLPEADRIILCGSTWENIDLAVSLSDAGFMGKIHLFADNSNAGSLINNRNCSLVGTISEENIEKVLLMDDIHKSGKMCHATYMLEEKADVETLTYSDIVSYLDTVEFKEGYDRKGKDYPADDPDIVAGWSNLDSFTKGSNYSTAIHDPLKYQLLMNHDIDVKGLDAEANKLAFDKLEQSAKDYLQEIEHIRWCRYHLINNWNTPDGDIIVNGEKKAKDSKKRLHSCLVPYNKLSRKDKDKDAYFFKTLALRIPQETNKS